jgi:sigma-E factor negative regulatory protein RseA
MSEQISTLLDGELAQGDFSKEISAVLSNKKAMQTWRDYQVIGDAMRQTPALSEGFTAKLMEKIELEPTVLAPNALPRIKHKAHTSQKKSGYRLPVVWSMAASCAAVLVVGWAMVNQQWQSGAEVAPMALAQTPVQATQVAQSQPAPISQPVVAKNQAPSAAVTTQVAEADISDAPMEYLAAHHASAPSISSYYIQSASFSE